MLQMDVHMPGMDGLAATRSIREFERTQHLPATRILALTADTFEGDAQASREAGCDEHIVKPISKQKLLATIEEFSRAAKA